MAEIATPTHHWRFASDFRPGAEVLNPQGLRVEGVITLYRIARVPAAAQMREARLHADALPLSLFFTDYWGRRRRDPKKWSRREKQWPILVHSCSAFSNPLKAVDVAEEFHIGDHLAVLVIDTDQHSEISVCLSPGRDPSDSATYHFDLFGPPATLRRLVESVQPLTLSAAMRYSP